MVDPKQVESIINKADAVLDTLAKRCKLVFKVPLVRTKVAFIGYQVIWNEWDKKTATEELINLGFDNLTLIQILECFIFLGNKVAGWKSNPKRVTDPLILEAMKEKVMVGVRRRIGKGQF